MNHSSDVECLMAGGDRLHPALRQRFSPSAFDPHAVVDDHIIDALLDAARFAPSAGNSQPWSFVVGVRGDLVHARIVAHLARSSSRWASDASVLFVNLAHILVADTDWEYSEFSRYDLGQAVAHMTVQGLCHGLAAHQFRAFDREAVVREFGLPREWEATSMTAMGVAVKGPGESPSLGSNRTRRGRDDVAWDRV